MTAPGWYNEGKKLIEGETYPFQFIRIVPLSDNMNYMLMEDPYGIRHLVPYDYYIQYDLVTGSMINCRVDKINCTGRVFLEPEHPHYKIGTKGNFKLLRIEKSQNDEKIYCLIIQDIFGNEVIMEVNDEIQEDLQNRQINCLVEGIKRGVPVLRFLGESRS
jgi:hypothetical protein